MEALVKGAESVFTTKTVVGEATKIDDTIIIPLVDVSFGIGAGASCGAGKDSRKNGGRSVSRGVYSRIPRYSKGSSCKCRFVVTSPFNCRSAPLKSIPRNGLG